MRFYCVTSFWQAFGDGIREGKSGSKTSNWEIRVDCRKRWWRGFLDQGGQRSHPRCGEGCGEPRERRTVTCDHLQVAWSPCNSLRQCFPKGDPHPIETCGGCLLEVQLLKPTPRYRSRRNEAGSLRDSYGNCGLRTTYCLLIPMPFQVEGRQQSIQEG